MIPFSLLWGGFAISWELGVLDMAAKTGQPMGFVMALFGIPFVLVGLYLIAGRFFVDSHMRAKTHYGVTDQRAVIVSGLLSRKVTSLPFKSMPQVTLTERSDGSGTITFGQPVPFAFMSEGLNWPGMGSWTVPAFSLIENAKDVYRQIRSAQDA
ncbi:MAG: PH domain-containing protein [Deltaproteobacteria bacterium]|nr:PH domain-containing protein [Deltaproteobacteria bacterium]